MFIDTVESAKAINHWITLFDAGLYQEAEQAAQKITDQFPTYATGWYALGQSRYFLKNVQGALPVIEKAFALEPNNSNICGNLGMVLNELGFQDEAEIKIRHALSLNSQNAKIYYHLANCLADKQHFFQATEAFETMVKLEPNNANYHANYAFSLLRDGRFAEGWREYQWLYHPNCTSVNKPKSPQLSKPQWQGESLNNKTIIICCEQGLGDMIQIVRYGELLQKQGAKVWIATPPPLVDLFKTVPCIDNVCCDGDPIKTSDYDYWTFLFALPFFFKTDVFNIPINIPYFKIDEKKSAWWKIWLTKQISLKHKKIGLVWAGNPQHANDKRRSIDLSEFSKLGKIENITFVSLQLSEAKNALKNVPENLTILDASAFIHDFTDSAALLNELDLLITVDSAPAHLAGALAKPVWVLLPAVPDWRWLINRVDSPWYPTMTLFRQTKLNDWSTVFQQLKTALIKLCS